MDQDSIVDAHFMRAYETAVGADDSLVCLAPRIIGSVHHPHEGGGDVPYAVTSGNLVRASVFQEIGPYDAGFFIDCIDFDFCLRVRQRGHRIVRIGEALMQHQLGETATLPRPARRFYARHPPVRRYYMFRNYLYLLERHLRRFPGFTIKLGLLHGLLLTHIALYDTSPIASYRGVVRGVWDYLRRVDGRYEGPAL
jgi:rhamnosyltransferase